MLAVVPPTAYITVNEDGTQVYGPFLSEQAIAPVVRLRLDRYINIRKALCTLYLQWVLPELPYVTALEDIDPRNHVKYFGGLVFVCIPPIANTVELKGLCKYELVYPHNPRYARALGVATDGGPNRAGWPRSFVVHKCVMIGHVEQFLVRADGQLHTVDRAGMDVLLEYALLL
ncbi:hypothetical protein AURDEDRAFT_164839 [Auricularia subglabra TFB-10046 SS5]|nr:hypothetical protein AURDEDRAFT_164839 [Auricularia subglabra TFB-10046 SS5]